LKYLLDTCVISELIKPKPEKSVAEWIKGINESFLFLSVLTLGEIHKGINKLPASKKRRTLERWVSEDLCQRFENQIITITMEIARVWGEMQGKAESKGDTIPVIDGFLSATAIAHDLTIVTRNTNDMEKTGVSIYNPWEPL